MEFKNKVVIVDYIKKVVNILTLIYNKTLDKKFELVVEKGSITYKKFLSQKITGVS